MSVEYDLFPGRPCFRYPKTQVDGQWTSPVHGGPQSVSNARAPKANGALRTPSVVDSQKSQVVRVRMATELLVYAIVPYVP